MALPSRPRRRRLRLGAAVGVAALLAAGALFVWRLTWATPAWWSPPDPTDESVTALADDVEFWLTSQTHKIRPTHEQWRIEITQEQLNAWLSARLPEWIAHARDVRWPDRLGPPQVLIEEGGIRFGLEFVREGRSRYVVARIVPRISGDRLTLAADRVTLGRLRIPGAPVRMAAGRLSIEAPSELVADPSVRAAFGSMLGGTELDAILTLSDGRRVQLIDVRCREGTLVLTCQTRAPGSGLTPDS